MAASLIKMCMQLNANPRPKPIHRYIHAPTLFAHKTLKSVPIISSLINAKANKTYYYSPEITNDTMIDESSMKRRSGNYGASQWDFEFLQALNSEYSGESQFIGRVPELRMQVKMLLEDESKKQIERLESIDDLQRLGISYHFEDEIKKILTNIYEENYINHHHHHHHHHANVEKDLYYTALEFRILRQRRFEVSQDVFDRFKNENGEFNSNLEKDTKGLIQLYEASYLSTEGEDTLELARQFSTKILEKIDNYLDNNITNDNDDENIMIMFALEMPLHWRVPRPNARVFIEAYEKRKHKNSILLELAKLDFNIVQAAHQEEVKEVSRWWKRTDLARALPFARDRVVENYFWALGMFDDHRNSYQRVTHGKLHAMISVIDDIYDIYGTIQELELFTHAIERWDVEAMDKLPNYMQTCFMALNNLINEMAFDILKEQNFLIVPYLRKAWFDLCKAYLQEAKWYSEGYTPTLEEYINNGRISTTGPAVLCHAFFLVTNPIGKESVQLMNKYHDLILSHGIIFRLSNDLATSQHEVKRGDVQKSIECYMNETGVSEEEAREHILCVRRETWKKMNKELKDGKSPFVNVANDLIRMALYMYQHGDSDGIQEPQSQIKQRISKVIFNPIPIY